MPAELTTPTPLESTNIPPAWDADYSIGSDVELDEALQAITAIDQTQLIAQAMVADAQAEANARAAKLLTITGGPDPISSDAARAYLLDAIDRYVDANPDVLPRGKKALTIGGATIKRRAIAARVELAGKPGDIGQAIADKHNLRAKIARLLDKANVDDVLKVTIVADKSAAQRAYKAGLLREDDLPTGFYVAEAHEQTSVTTLPPLPAQSAA